MPFKVRVVRAGMHRDACTVSGLGSEHAYRYRKIALVEPACVQTLPDVAARKLQRDQVLCRELHSSRVMYHTSRDRTQVHLT